jgi:hypothetical protein
VAVHPALAVRQIGVIMCGQGDECLQVAEDDFGCNVLGYGLLGQTGAVLQIELVLEPLERLPKGTSPSVWRRSFKCAASSTGHNWDGPPLVLNRCAWLGSSPTVPHGSHQNHVLSLFDITLSDWARQKLNQAP